MYLLNITDLLDLTKGWCISCRGKITQ